MSALMSTSMSDLGWTRRPCLERTQNLSLPEEKMSKLTLNTPAPDFELADISGNPVRLSDLRGRNVLLVFNRGFA